MIKAVLFDFGGVILDMRPLLKRLAATFKPKNLNDFWNYLNLKVIPLCKNQTSEEKFWKQVAIHYGVSPNKVPKHLWTKDFNKLVKLDKNMLKLIKHLKPKYQVSIISNIIESHAKIIRNYPFLNIFDDIILSCEVRLTKDKKSIFLMAAKRLSLNPKECVFVDDIKKFVDVAESAGMKGILFKNYNQLNKELRKLLHD